MKLSLAGAFLALLESGWIASPAKRYAHVITPAFLGSTGPAAKLRESQLRSPLLPGERQAETAIRAKLQMTTSAQPRAKAAPSQTSIVFPFVRGFPRAFTLSRFHAFPCTGDGGSLVTAESRGSGKGLPEQVEEGQHRQAPRNAPATRAPAMSR